MYNVLVVEDEEIIRKGIILSIPWEEFNCHVIGEAENGEEAIDLCVQNQVDVALLDIRMPKLNGVQAVKRIVEKTDTKCLIITTFDEEEYVNEAISYGAKGYILKNSSPEQIIDAINTVYNNNVVLNDSVLDKIQGKQAEPIFKKYDFTEREKEIIVSISEGLSNKEISNKLFISEGTVRNYITNILEKTNLEHRTAIAVNYLKGKL